MSISGSLEDVSVTDVMQFIHLGRRTGTLVLEHAGQHARVGFHSGKLISARGPGQAMMGDLLVAAGVVGQAALDAALATQATQKSGPERRSLGQILVAGGSVAPQELRTVIVQQIEHAISEVLSWDRGTFHFAVDGLQPVDDIGLYPGELVPDADINTQMILLEAARIFDERNRADGVGPADPGPGAAVAEPPVAWIGGDEREPTPAPAVGSPAIEVRVASTDPALLDQLQRVASRLALRIEAVDGLDRLGAPALGEDLPIVVLDLRPPGAGLADLARLHREHPRVPIVALVAGERSAAGAYEAGAVAVLAAAAALPACLDNLVASRRAGQAVLRRGESPMAGVARLRRILGELRSGFISATAALSLMHIISESVERAVLLLVRGEGLTAIGAFGAAPDGRPLAGLTRGLKVALDGDYGFDRCLGAAEAHPLRFDDDLPAGFARAVGRPRNGQAVLFPVPGARRVIAIVYADNGERPEPVEDIEILEIATAQVGMAFENELLRRRPALVGA